LFYGLRPRFIHIYVSYHLRNKEIGDSLANFFLKIARTKAGEDIFKNAIKKGLILPSEGI